MGCHSVSHVSIFCVGREKFSSGLYGVRYVVEKLRSKESNLEGVNNGLQFTWLSSFYEEVNMLVNGILWDAGQIHY